jgi:hypothetical protein
MLDTLKIERRKIQQTQQHTQPNGLRLFNFREKYNKSGFLMIVPIYAKVSITKVPYKQKQSVLQHKRDSHLQR